MLLNIAGGGSPPPKKREDMSGGAKEIDSCFSSGETLILSPACVILPGTTRTDPKLS